MAAALEFKRRVRAKPDLPPRRVRERHTPVLGLGLIGWTAAVCIGLGIDRGYLPVKAWAAELESSASDELSPPANEPESPPLAPTPEPAPIIAAPSLRAPESVASEETPGDDSAPVDVRDPDEDRNPIPSERSSSAAQHSPIGESPRPRWSRAPESSEALVTRPPRVADRMTPRPAEPEPEPEPADERVASLDLPEPEGPPVKEEEPVAVGSTSCEAAIAANEERIVMGQRTAPDLSREQFASVLEDGRWFDHCGVSARVGLEVCVAAKRGRAVGVTVRSRPRDSRAERCVAAAARRLSFPPHERLDVTRTTFSPE